jgi:hypothetical protein
MNIAQLAHSCPYEVSILQVAKLLADCLWAGRKVDHSQVRAYMNRAFGGSDANGAWCWKDVYEAQECAIVLILERYAAKFQQSPATVMARLAQLEALQLTHTVRSEDSIKLQQFSTPPQLGYLLGLAAQMTADDVVIEPSAGTGLLARFARLWCGKLVLNEIDDRRISLLKQLFQQEPVFSFNAEQLHDRLPIEIQPTVVLMNPPFSATPLVNRRNAYATANHVRSAFARLVPGGRLVLLSGSWFCPTSPVWQAGLSGLDQLQVRWTATVTGNAYYKHGSTVDTRITVIDKIAEPQPMIETELVMAKGTFSVDEIEKLQTVPARAIAPPLPMTPPPLVHLTVKRQQTKRTVALPPIPVPTGFVRADIRPVTYQVIQEPQTTSDDGIYAVYQPQRVRIDGARPHPSVLCESIALNAVLPPIPTYLPMLPAAVVEQGLLSEAQLEAVIYAGEAHSRHLSGYYTVEADWEKIVATSAATPGAVRLRTGWCNGNGTGSGKGREICGTILDNFCQGRTKAVWVSRSDKLLKDARRDWCALGGIESEVVPLSQFKQGEAIALSQGILFVSYATLRSVSKVGNPSRLQQVVNWLGSDFEGVIAFDESHSMGNATIADSEYGEGSGQASQQGRAGLKLQRAVPNARVLYVSATGATKVANLGYAERLGLWGTGDFPFPSQADFIQQIEQGGVAALEMVCRDLKALGLYHAHNLSFDGVEYDSLEVELTPQQVELYDTYADAFQIIHEHLEQALRICKITDLGDKSLNKDAKRAAMSLFESTKQRFFNHLLTSMKCPTLIHSIEADLARGDACVIQLVSTAEELMERRLAEIPTQEWQNLTIDITPREYVMHYLDNAFPVRLYEEYSDENNKVRSRPVVTKDGDPVISQAALVQRDALVAKLSHLPPLASALDQLLHHFGADQVAEVTGRSRRILCERDTGRLYVSSRPSSSNVCEVQAFMDDQKRILVFSDAGSTGESYHAATKVKNNRHRNHYILEAGWVADRAVQSLGRSHRTDQSSAPLFRLVTTNVHGERRFISTIARRLDALGALTKGQRQTGGQNLFDSRDNLESPYAAAALKVFFTRLSGGHIRGHSLAQFEQTTGLTLRDSEGRLKDELPKMATFLNRMLALPIAMQNSLFSAFEELLDMTIESAKQNGTFEVGVEIIRAHSLRVVSRQQIYSHAVGGITTYIEVERLDRNFVLSADAARRLGGELLVNSRSGRAAVSLPACSTMSEEGVSIPRRELVHPASRVRIPVRELQSSCWKLALVTDWEAAWQAEADLQPEFLTSRFFLICGLLLPIWNHLQVSSENPRVFRLVTDDGEKLLGRIVDAGDMPKLVEALGINQVKLTSTEVYDLVMNKRQSYKLGNLMLKRAIVMQDARIEVVGEISQSLGLQFKAAGCFTEVMSWKTRYFIPSHEVIAPSVIEQIRALMELLG